jgi:hypothetical protein
MDIRAFLENHNALPSEAPKLSLIVLNITGSSVVLFHCQLFTPKESFKDALFHLNQRDRPNSFLAAMICYLTSRMDVYQGMCVLLSTLLQHAYVDQPTVKHGRHEDLNYDYSRGVV